MKKCDQRLDKKNSSQKSSVTARDQTSPSRRVLAVPKAKPKSELVQAFGRLLNVRKNEREIRSMQERKRMKVFLHYDDPDYNNQEEVENERDR